MDLTRVSNLSQAEVRLVKEGELIYAHPFNISDTAFFGQVIGFKNVQVKKGKVKEKFVLQNKLSFSYCKKYGFWMADKYVDDAAFNNILFDPRDLSSYDFYFGLEEIKEAMKENNNPNGGRVEIITRPIF